MERTISFRWGWVVAILAVVVFAGCEPAEEGEEGSTELGDEVGTEVGDEVGNDDVIEVIGTGLNDYDGTEVITAEAWNDTAIISFSNQDNWVVTQNAADLPDDAYGVASAYNKIVWSEPVGNTFYYCWVAFDLDTQEEAEEAENIADADDLSGAGCGGFPWTKVTLSDD